MQFNYIELIGLVAALLTTSAFVPQVIKTYKTKNVEGLSFAMYFVFFIGVLLWLVYGIFIESFAVILANLITAFLAFILLYFKIKYQNKK